MRSPDAPKTPPPNFVPEKEKALALGFTKTPGINVVLPGTVVPCQFKFTYIWMNNRVAFWAKPVAIDNKSVKCWIWNGTSWNYKEISLKNIDAFICETF